MSIDTAKAKLQKEAKGDLLTEAIAGHLVEIMDDELAALVERPDYTAGEMGRFVLGKAREQLHGRDGGLPDEVVYGYATDYYHASRGEIAKTVVRAGTGKVSTSTKTAKTETKAPKTVTKKPETVTKPADPVIKPPKKAKAVAEGQLSLFDLMGGFGDA
ncbi:MAG: hypothetical protein IJ174_06655 [Clostridia bacterium]|nr:hypothetical protein [Clostridia bacterium]